MASGGDVDVNIVDTRSTSLSASGVTPETESLESSPTRNGDARAISGSGGPPSLQSPEIRRMENKLAHVLEVVSKQREDIERILKSVDGLRQGMISLQEYMDRIEMERSTSQKNLVERVQRQEAITQNRADSATTSGANEEWIKELISDFRQVRHRVDSLESANAVRARGPAPRPLQTARMTGPLARRPHSSTRSPTLTTTLRASPTNSPSIANSPVTATSTDLQDVPMSQHPAQSFGYASWQPVNQVSFTTQPTVSPSATLEKDETITVASYGAYARNNMIDNLMGPPALPDTQSAPHGPSQRVSSFIEDTPMSSINTAEQDTQRYLQQNVRVDDLTDRDYEPSRRSQSLASPRPRALPASVEVQLSLDNIVDSATPTAPGGTHDFAQNGNRSVSGRSRRSLHEDQRQTPEWERDSWGASGQATPNGYTPDPMGTYHDRGSNASRRGVSGGPGFGRTPKRQKKMTKDGKLDGRSAEKKRNAEGYLLRADGSVDMRSARYKPKDPLDAGDAGQQVMLANPDAPPHQAEGQFDEKHRKIMQQIFRPSRADSVQHKKLRDGQAAVEPVVL